MSKGKNKMRMSDILSSMMKEVNDLADTSFSI